MVKKVRGPVDALSSFRCFDTVSGQQEGLLACRKTCYTPVIHNGSLSADGMKPLLELLQKRVAKRNVYLNRQTPI